MERSLFLESNGHRIPHTFCYLTILNAYEKKSFETNFQMITYFSSHENHISIWNCSFCLDLNLSKFAKHKHSLQFTQAYNLPWPYALTTTLSVPLPFLLTLFLFPTICHLYPTCPAFQFLWPNDFHYNFFQEIGGSIINNILVILLFQWRKYLSTHY